MSRFLRSTFNDHSPPPIVPFRLAIGEGTISQKITDSGKFERRFFPVATFIVLEGRKQRTTKTLEPFGSSLNSYNRHLLERSHAMLNEAQTAVLNNNWEDIQSLICAEIHRRNLHNDLDDILSDAITRLITAVAKHDLRSPEAIKNRADKCGKDAIRTLVRVRRNLANYRQAVQNAHNHLPRHNGETMNLN